MLRGVLNAVVVLAVAGALFLTWPHSLGGRVSYLMVSGQSMQPTMHLGDVAIVRTEDVYHRGDIVAYTVPKADVGAGAVVIHRIVGGNARAGYTMRGDNNSYDDVWHPHARDILGRRWALLPQAGDVFARLRGPVALAAFAALLAALGAHQILGLPSRRAKRDQSVTPALSVAGVTLRGDGATIRDTTPDARQNDAHARTERRPLQPVR